jgi:hypothetical protein
MAAFNIGNLQLIGPFARLQIRCCAMIWRRYKNRTFGNVHQICKSCELVLTSAVISKRLLHDVRLPEQDKQVRVSDQGARGCNTVRNGLDVWDAGYYLAQRMLSGESSDRVQYDQCNSVRIEHRGKWTHEHVATLPGLSVHSESMC